MKNLKEILGNRYLGIREYYKLAFKLTGKIFRENKIWIFVLIFAVSIDDIFILPAGLKNLEWIKSIFSTLILSISCMLFYR